jgi:hypothetical protein
MRGLKRSRGPAADAVASAQSRSTPPPAIVESAVTRSAAASAYEVEEITGASRGVRLRAPNYIPFENLTPAQRAARDELRGRLRSLVAAPGEILHASFAGPKPGNMDVENLLLYNIEGAGCFSQSVKHGVRFELASGTRLERSPEGGCLSEYLYRLIHADRELDCWRKSRRLVTFTNVSLGRFPATGRHAQTRLGLRRSGAAFVESSIAAAEPFGVFLTLRVPPGGRGTPGAVLVKSLIDGVVAAFQAHGDLLTVRQVAERLGRAIGEEPAHVAEMPLDQRQAALGVVDQLVRARAGGVQWNPGDHMCVAGQVLRDEARGRDWRLSGELRRLEPVTPQAPR